MGALWSSYCAPAADSAYATVYCALRRKISRSYIIMLIIMIVCKKSRL